MNNITPESLAHLNLMMLCSSVFILFVLTSYFFLFRKNRYFLPHGFGQWSLTSLLFMLGAFSALLLVASFGTKLYLTSEAPYFLQSIEQKAPPLQFTLLDNSKSELSSYNGKVVLLNFWATWCGPCRRELPALEELKKRYEAQGLVILALSDEERADIDRFLKNNPIALSVGTFVFETLLPPFSDGARSRPFSFIIDRTGKIRDFVIGAGSLQFFESKLQPILKEP